MWKLFDKLFEVANDGCMFLYDHRAEIFIATVSTVVICSHITKTVGEIRVDVSLIPTENAGAIIDQ